MICRIKNIITKLNLEEKIKSKRSLGMVSFRTFIPFVFSTQYCTPSVR